MDNILLEDIQKLTQIKPAVLKKIESLSKLCICDYINSLQNSTSDVIHVDIGLGNINILISDESVEYSFTPSKDLEKMVLHTLESNKSPLMSTLEDNLESRVKSTYKDLI